ncbi:MAG TPA: hypothetical protein DCS43_12825 [Verrucomicrobia bacterium]|nr:hypothetical protein [Verrucomicrobiota bacterium]
MVGIATLCRATGRLPQAITMYRQALTLDPEHRMAQTGLGIALLDVGQTVEALKLLVGVLQQEPSNTEAQNAVRRAMHPD